MSAKFWTPAATATVGTSEEERAELGKRFGCDPTWMANDLEKRDVARRGAGKLLLDDRDEGAGTHLDSLPREPPHPDLPLEQRQEAQLELGRLETGKAGRR